MSSVSFQSHNHKLCLKSALQVAEDICQAQGERLTPLRKTVLEFVWSNHEPVKAYDLLDKLKAVHSSSAPPTVYRALDFLQSLGLVHKIESLNAYLGCGEPGEKHRCQFLICRICGSAAELDSDQLYKNIAEDVSSVEFSVEDITLEIQGVCRQCKV